MDGRGAFKNKLWTRFCVYKNIKELRLKLNVYNNFLHLISNDKY